MKFQYKPLPEFRGDTIGFLSYNFSNKLYEGKTVAELLGLITIPHEYVSISGYSDMIVRIKIALKDFPRYIELPLAGQAEPEDKIKFVPPPITKKNAMKDIYGYKFG